MKTSSSKFAEDQLRKYGWKEGDGIGKTSQGMVNPIKASLKFDNSGVGFKLSEQFTTNWWENLFNTTASSIDTSKKVEIKEEKPEPVANPLNRKSFFYSRFQKGSTLVDGRTIKDENDVEEKKEVEEDKSKKLVSDEELYKMCEGRTAHKGARHGIKMNGKLARIEEQEKILAEKLKSNETELVEDEMQLKSKSKKKKRRTESGQNLEENFQNNEKLEEITEDVDEEVSVKRKKKKSKKSSE